MKNDIKPVVTEIVSREVETQRSERLPRDEEPLKIGQWFWVNEPDEEEWFGCITHVGSNYVEMTSTHEGSTRVHFDEFDARCRPEPDPEKVIRDNVEKHQGEVKQLMERVIQVTARLGVSSSPELPSGSETQALATVQEGGQSFSTYKTELVKAKTELLPELFKEIEVANKTLVRWLKASVVPFKAQVSQMHGVIGRIDDRIFNVELYAGLAELVEQITDGEPAPITEKIRLLQRRCYMDEECLAQYEVGGMEFKDICDFDAWLARPANRDRLLPFPRCIVSFQVRRHQKERSTFGSFIQMQQMIEKIKADKYTFLYIRNGEKLYRMGSELEFGEKLFPDMDQQKLMGKLWALGAPNVKHVITDDEFQGRCEDYARKKKEHKKQAAEHKIQHAAWKEATAAAKAAGEKFDEKEPYFWDRFWDNDPKQEYQEFEPNNIYYDDIQNKVQQDIQHHNRIGLIIQGLLDRSPILHPHPPWKIWSAEGFRMALELVYDESRALVAGEKPDFAAYWAKANESLTVGSVTIGQQKLWLAAEAEKESQRRGGDFHREYYQPYGNPGPGTLAKVIQYRNGSLWKSCSYAWERDGQSNATYGQKIRAKFTCKVENVFNADGYKPGDFRKFFNDPRTREEYLEWAPLLLEAEEYHAGNREITPPPPPKVKKVASWEAQRAYQRRQIRKQFMGKAVKNREKIETKGGKVYEAGSLWRVMYSETGQFTIYGILPDGSQEPGDRRVRGVDYRNLAIEGGIPAERVDPGPAGA
jgi:hypothetical protein